MINGSIQGDITIVNMYTPNTQALQYIRQMLTAKKVEIDSNTIVRDFNTTLTTMDRSSRKKINKESQALYDTLNQIDLIDIYRPIHLKAAKYTFF